MSLGREPTRRELAHAAPPCRARPARRAARSPRERRGELAFVGDHDRRSCPPHGARAAATRSPRRRRVSRFPVGSSANRIRGRPTIARATATRWRSPPDSWLGRCSRRWERPTALERLLRTRTALAERHTRVEEPVGDVVTRRATVEQEELLEHEADRPRSQRRELAVCHLRRGVTVDAHRPAVGRSSVPSTCSSVDFPEPDGPTIASSSPASTRSETPRRAATSAPYRFSRPAASSTGRHSGTTTFAPATIPFPETSTYPSANVPVSTAGERALAPRADELDRLAAAAKSEDRLDRDSEHVLARAPARARPPPALRRGRRASPVREPDDDGHRRRRRLALGGRRGLGHLADGGSARRRRRPEGSSTRTAAPTRASSCCVASRSISTTGVVPVTWSTACPGWSCAPTDVSSWPILRGPGRNTASPTSIALRSSGARARPATSEPRPRCPRRRSRRSSSRPGCDRARPGSARAARRRRRPQHPTASRRQSGIVP